MNRLQPGDRVRVTRGLFSGVGGLFVGQQPRERVLILLSLLGGSRWRRPMSCAAETRRDAKRLLALPVGKTCAIGD